ncbi:MAG: hypothetical protein MI685_00070, partial [Chlorobiales bacterium]|nr:hypothetical protein [Chlorobiales bacterium]
SDTCESLKAEIDYLSSLQATFYQFQIVTPLPGSKMFKEYRTRIINWNWADWNCNTLVWKHPHITPREMENILVYAKRKTSLSKILFEMIKRGALDDAFDGDSILSTVLKQAFRLSSLLRQPSVR